jgi:hypothetical protein
MENDYTVKIEDGRIMFMTSYRNEFGEDCSVANIISKEKLIEIRDDINLALAELSDDNSNCNIPVVGSSVMFTLDDMHKAYNAGMDRGSDVARAVVQRNDKLIKADDFITFMRKHYC